MFDKEGHWEGATIRYDRQRTLKELHADIVSIFAIELFEKGDYGPAGVDVMTDEAGRQTIIDMNPRLTGDYLLGLLKYHFTSRGLLVSA